MLKKILPIMLCLLGLTILGASTAGATLVLNYDGLSGATIDIAPGGGLSFSPASPADNFSISSASGATDGTTVGLQGSIGGSFAIVNVTNPFDAVYLGDVTGTGTFSITDTNGNVFSAVLTWDNISNLGTGNTLNYTGTANLSSISYTGSGLNNDLLAFANGGINTLTFQFTPTVTLPDLVKVGGTTSFSGSMTPPVPIPASVLLLGSGLLGLVGLGRRRKS